MTLPRSRIAVEPTPVVRSAPMRGSFKAQAVRGAALVLSLCAAGVPCPGALHAQPAAKPNTAAAQPATAEAQPGASPMLKSTEIPFQKYTLRNGLEVL